VAVRSG